MSQKYDSVNDYFWKNPEVFAEKRSMSHLAIRVVLLVVVALVFIQPGLLMIPANMLLIAQIVAGIIGLYALFSLIFGGKTLTHTASGGIIGDPVRWKFDSSTGIDEIVALFDKKDFSALDNLPCAADNPTQLYIYKNTVAKEVYTTVMHYYSSSDFRAAADVLTITEKSDPKNYAILVGASDRS